MIQTIKISPSTLNIFADCPLCFWLQYTKDVKRPEGIFPSLPSGMDRILKENFDSFRQKNEMPPELKELSGMKLFADIKLLNEWRNNRKGISHENNGVIFRGAVDDVLTNAGKLVVLDFKTRGYPLKEDTHKYYQGQLDAYTYLLERNGFETEHYGYLLFYYPDKVVGNGLSMFETRLVKVDTDPSQAEKKLNDAVACIKSNEPPEASAECQYCKYSEARKESRY